jgi:tetratricopeptide (TPR) repeat protein
MRWRFLLIGIAAAVLTAPSAFAADTKDWIEPPAKLPHAQKGDPTRNLDFLFEALKIAPDENTAKQIEQRIWALWFLSPSDTAYLLMTRVRTALEGKDTDLALQLLDAIVAIKPDYVEAWNRRATIYFMKQDYGRSLADLREVLKREPRHFGALSGLAQIMALTGHKQSALEAWQKVLVIYPMMRSAQDQVATLSEELAGEGI